MTQSVCLQVVFITCDPAVPDHRICMNVVLGGFSLQVRKDKKKRETRFIWSLNPFSTESFSNEHHEFLLALVYLLQVVYELRELDVSVMRHQECLSGFTEELDELAVVTWADVCQPRVCCVDVGPDSGVQQLPERSLVQRHQLPRVSATV